MKVKSFKELTPDGQEIYQQITSTIEKWALETNNNNTVGIEKLYESVILLVFTIKSLLVMKQAQKGIKPNDTPSSN